MDFPHVRKEVAIIWDLHAHDSIVLLLINGNVHPSHFGYLYLASGVLNWLPVGNLRRAVNDYEKQEEKNTALIQMRYEDFRVQLSARKLLIHPE
jgi:hypothetical protein